MPFDDLRSGFNPRPGDVPAPAGTSEPSTHQSPAPSSPVSPGRRRVGIIVGGTVVAALLALLGYLLFPRTADDPMDTAEAFLRAYAAGDESEVAELSCPGTDWRTWEFTDWVGTAPGPGDRNGTIGYCLFTEPAALAWAANLAALELHAPMARAVDIESPTMVVFDLDPGPGTGIVECCEVALPSLVGGAVLLDFVGLGHRRLSIRSRRGFRQMVRSGSPPLRDYATSRRARRALE